ncbi:MAG: hypothetical protein JWQ29_993 [Phenylobacterium sp.]|nr:hypothetical protein [Phenylobacterium sp.]
MLMWLSLSIGTVLCVVTLAVALGLSRAERRARRSLYGALGISEDLIPALMSQKGPVSAQIALVRDRGLAPPAARPDETRGAPGGLQEPARRSFRLDRGLNGARTAGGEPPGLAAARRRVRADRREPF